MSTRQQNVLDQLEGYGSQTVTLINFGNRDLASLNAVTGDEFAMLSTEGRRLIFRGDATSVPINVEKAIQLSSQGWKWSSHIHLDGVLRSSTSDRAIIKVFEDTGKGKESAIYMPDGKLARFNSDGDNLMG